MALFTIYWIGILISFCLFLFESIKTGEVTVKSLIASLFLSVLSWIGVSFFILESLKNFEDKVIWRKKK